MLVKISGTQLLHPIFNVLILSTYNLGGFVNSELIRLSTSHDFKDNCFTCPGNAPVATILFSYYGWDGNLDICNSPVYPCSVTTATTNAWVESGSVFIYTNVDQPWTSYRLSWSSHPSDPCVGIGKVLNIYYTCSAGSPNVFIQGNGTPLPSTSLD